MEMEAPDARDKIMHLRPGHLARLHSPTYPLAGIPTVWHGWGRRRWP